MGKPNYNRGTLYKTNRFLVAAIVMAALSACAHHADLTRPSTQDNVGVEMARMNLWREAMFRFQRAVQINPSDAMAHNNLAVAYEATGDFEAAAKEYREALRLDRSNTYIQKNYSRYTEFMARSKKKAKGSAVTASDTAPAGATTSAKGGSTPAKPVLGDRPPSTGPAATPPQPAPAPPVIPPLIPPPSNPNGGSR